MSDATENDEALAITAARAREVFHDMKLCRQELSILESLIGKAIARNDPNPVPKIEIEGIRELLGILWNPALDAVSPDPFDPEHPTPRGGPGHSRRVAGERS